MAVVESTSSQEQKKTSSNPKEGIWNFLTVLVLFAMLARDEYAPLVKRLKRELMGNAGRESWTIEPVIAHLKPYLRTHDAEFLEAVTEAISSEEKMGSLNAFPIWCAGGSSSRQQE